MLLVTIVWQDHYTALVVERHASRITAVLFDPSGEVDGGTARRYPSPPTAALSAACGVPRVRRVRWWNPQGDDPTDLFCSMWTLWFLAHGYRAWRTAEGRTGGRYRFPPAARLRSAPIDRLIDFPSSGFPDEGQ